MRILLILLMTGSLGSCGLLTSPEQEFWERVTALCGNAYNGELVEDTPPGLGSDLDGKPLQVNVRDCSSRAISLDFIVDGHLHAVWELEKLGDEIELRHIHKDSVTGYGGYSSDDSSGSRMNFPADDTTKLIFDEAGIPVSKQNTWAMSVRAGSVFQYEMSRPGRMFLVEFDTSNPVNANITDTH